MAEPPLTDEELRAIRRLIFEHTPMGPKKPTFEEQMRRQQEMNRQLRERLPASFWRNLTDDEIS